MTTRAGSTLPLARLDEVNPPVFRKTGRPPWRVMRSGGSEFHVAVIDADGNAMCICTPDVAGRIVGAVNLVECAHPIERGRVDEQS